ncbi:MAG: hypothetical protein CVT49_04040 [candidate division Zixibacteria bacterium HGW-Zixibacteria-1]|nr:MAG: hypothetical protein CVT49_04040 [candidate division Zixibacteria bacterium HGW-Zixibacteria-1]
MRKLVKWTIYGIIYILVLPFGLLSLLWYKIFGSQAIYYCCAETFSLLPVHLGILVRCAFYNQTLKEAHHDLVVLFGGYLSKMESRIGRKVIIAGHATIGLVDIRDYAAIGNNTNILSGRHHHNFEETSQEVFSGEDRFAVIKVGQHAFIGDNSVIMAHIGDYSIIGAGSVVVKEIPDYVIAVGNPAKAVKERPRNGKQ